MRDTALLEYAKRNHHKILREASGRLHHPFIVPGSVYADQLWDWDCWLTNVALRQFVTEDIRPYEMGCVLNFLEHIAEDGRIPIMMTPAGVPVTSVHGNFHKPCLAQHAAFVTEQNGGDAEWLRPYFDRLLRFVTHYMIHCRHENGLYFWLDDMAIGVDNDPCTFFRPPKSSASIYLNCLMYKELEAVCYLGERLGISTLHFAEERDRLRRALHALCYDEKDGMYYSADLNLLPIGSRHSGAPRHWDSLIQRIGCWSGFLAMWSGVATPEQAERMVRENLLDEKAFWSQSGVRSLSKYEKMYTVKPSGNPSCWLGPVWGCVNYLVFRGLVKYGFETEAEQLATRTVNLFERDLQATGELHEYYDPETGAPIFNAGFQNWNLLAVNLQAWLDGDRMVTEF